jgi:hypothetical protein
MKLLERIRVLRARRLIVGPSNAPIDVTAGLLGVASNGPRVVKLALVANDAAAGAGAWLNPEAGAIQINRVTVDVTTINTGTGTLSVGVAATAVLSANLIDTLNVHIAGSYDNLLNPGTLGKASQRCAAGSYVTFSKASGALAGLVANAYIEYLVL